ncbi:MAG: hypothetical protein M1814_003173 [Vezdaea aestivalis]|nr:MAG: hypothetical protein M1814_003173 [Vezdaea aestivalis]
MSVIESVAASMDLGAVEVKGTSAPSLSVPSPAEATKPTKTPQDSVNAFWKRFNTTHPGKAYSILPDNLYAKRVALHAHEGAASGQNAATSYEEAAAACKRKVDKIVKECRRVNQKYRDVHFDIEFDLKRYQWDCLNGLVDNFGSQELPGSVKRCADVFEDPRFWVDGASSGDVRQGRDGDCWFLAALCTLSNAKGLIERVCVARDEQVGVYGFVFHRDGEWISTIIDDKLYLIKKDYDESSSARVVFDDGRIRPDNEEEYRRLFQTGSGALYFAQCSDPNETWLPLLEKAYAKAHGDFAAIDGGWCGEALEDLTGGVTHDLFSTDILDKEKFWTDELMKVNEEFLFGCGAGVFRGWGSWGYRKGIVEGHAYSIMKAVEIDGERLLLLRNPWGHGEWTGPWSDGSKEWTAEWMTKLGHVFGDDGAFWISYRDLLRKYQHFQRTRLFGPEWRVAQQWTTVQVPWATQYLATKFKLTVEQSGPIVLSLSQLDDRYFRGLQGRYYFTLQFRLHKGEEKDYIVRSNHRYGGNRSCSTELDLEVGTYTVFFKVEAIRWDDTKAPEDVVRETCTEKRDKLLQIGFSYDMAHAKGTFVETLREKTEREAEEEKEKQMSKEKLRKDRKERRVAAMKRKVHQWKGDALVSIWASAKVEETSKAARMAAGIPLEAEASNYAPPQAAEKPQEDTPSTVKEGETTEKDTSDKAVVQEPTPEPEAVPETKAEAKEALSKEGMSSNGTKTDESAKEPPTEKTETTALSASTESTTGGATVLTPQTSSAVQTGEDSTTPAAQNSTEVVIGSSAPPVQEPSVDDFDFADSVYSEYWAVDHPTDRPESIAEGGIAGSQAGSIESDDDVVDDQFSKDPWNAVCVVGLRAFSKNGLVTVEVVGPKKEEEGKVEEGVLDDDEQGKDAVKGVEGQKNEDVLEDARKEKMEKQELVKDHLGGDKKETDEEEEKGATTEAETKATPAVKDHEVEISKPDFL